MIGQFRVLYNVYGQRFQEMGVRTTMCNRDVIEQNEMIYVAVKPHVLPDVLRHLSTSVTKDKLIVSIAAGIHTSVIEEVGGVDE